MVGTRSFRGSLLDYARHRILALTSSIFSKGRRGRQGQLECESQLER
jgi:hypothetical protein